MRLRVVGTLLVGVGFATSRAHAADPTKKECIDANVQGQAQQQAGKFRAARTALQLCASSACPASVRDDCASRLDALEKVIPSVVFLAKDPSGHEFTDVSVKIDGEPLADRLDGTALAVDPGQHTFTFELQGRPTFTHSLMVHEGDRAIHERVVVPAETVPAAMPEPAPPAPIAPTQPVTVETPVVTPVAPSSAGQGQRVAGIVLSAVGVAGLGVGGVLGALTGVSWSSSKDNCNLTQCPNRAQALSDRDAALTMATGSNIAFAAGGVLLAAGIVVFLTAPHGGRTVGVLPNAGGATLVGSF